MKNFTFVNPTKIYFGKDLVYKTLNREIPKDKKILVTFGGGSVKRNGVYDQVCEALKEHATIEFWGIEPNPSYETLVKAIDIAKKESVDFVLAVGGGSVLDGSKFIAAAACYDGEPWNLIMRPALISKALPLGTMITLPATGSEMNNGGVISRKSTKEKFAFGSEHTFPVFSILDPQVAFSLPQHQIACGVVDTFAHTLEQYLTVSGESRLMDRWSESILQTLVEIGPKVVENGQDYDTMADFMLCATMALNGFTAMGVTVDWATHMIGHELTALHGLTHGVTLAIVYPALMKVMRNEKQGKLLQYGERVWGITTGTPQERIDKAIEKTENFFRSLGIPTTLSEHGVGAESFTVIHDRFVERRMKLGEGGIVTPEKVLEILQLCK
jgi:NADP-dependent alcohol dehydrogenase